MTSPSLFARPHVPDTRSAPPSLQGLRVLALESRMAKPLEKLIEKFEGRPQLAPSLREVPLEDQGPLFDFFARLEAGAFDLLVLTTGVGLRMFLKIMQSRYPLDRVLAALSKTSLVARGPKPLAVCKIHSLSVAVAVPEPNTWQDIVASLSERHLLAQKNIALLEYGMHNATFCETLERRGARVTPIQIYQWALPEDIEPLRRAVQALIADHIDLMLLTHATQIRHLLQIADTMQAEAALRRSLSRVGVISIGPTTSEALRECQIFPDYESNPHRMEAMVEQMAAVGAALLRQKRQRAEESRIRLQSPPTAAESEAGLQASPFWRACHRKKNSRIPIWIMRQAGRYMAEYQLLRRGVSFLDFCKHPDLAAEATLSAVERLNVDAAIIFADILLPVEALGLSLVFQEGEGPILSPPLRHTEDVEALKNFDPRESLSFVLQAIRKVRRSLHPRIPLIGFCGAPFTMASYMIEGQSSRYYATTKIFMREQPQAWHRLMKKLVALSCDFLIAQVEAGCQVLQIFDSWVGCLSVGDYRHFVFPHMQELFSRLPSNVPAIHFGTANPHLLPLQRAAGGQVIGLDWRTDMAQTWSELGDVAVQGNLDPILLFAKPEVFLEEAQRILRAVGSKPGFIFNLGHGVLPETPVDHVMSLIDFVHRWKVE